MYMLIYWRFVLNKPPIFTPPAGYDRIKVVSSFEELVTTPFGPRINALCWQRTLEGNFDELADCFRGEEDIVTLDEELLNGLRLSPSGRMAVEALLEDQRRLLSHGLSPSIECVLNYRRDENPVISTDVFSFHADRAPVQTDTYLCSYNATSTEGLRNDSAQKRMDIPETRAQLLKAFQQEKEAEDFEAYLMENCYDLHYAPRGETRPFSFGIGNLWRIAVEYPGSPVPPCLHRAPEAPPGQPRLLLIS
jgi:hypothetical protein